MVKLSKYRNIKNITLSIILALSIYVFYCNFANENFNQISQDYKNKDVIVMVLTTEKSLLDRAIAVWKTWGKDNKNIIFTMACEKIKKIRELKEKNQKIPETLKPFETTMNMPIHCLNLVEDYNQMGRKVFMVLENVYNIFKNKANWYLLVDDDTYVFSENLAKFSNSKNSSEKVIYGFKWSQGIEYIGGGAGMLFSGEAMRIIAERISKNECDQNLEMYGDISIGNCAHPVGIKPIYPFDNEGKPYFHPHTTKEHFKGPLPAPLYSAGSHNGKIGIDCCSKDSITFHYVQPNEMYSMYENKNYITDLLSDKIIFT